MLAREDANKFFSQRAVSVLKLKVLSFSLAPLTTLAGATHLLHTTQLVLSRLKTNDLIQSHST